MEGEADAELEEGARRLNMHVVTRQSVVEAMTGKGKLEHEGEDLPVLEPQKWGKMFTETIFDIALPARREKKAAQEGEEPALESEVADFIYYLPDYPSTKEEFEEFGKLRNCINMIYLIKEKKPEWIIEKEREEREGTPSLVPEAAEVSPDADENPEAPAEGEGEEAEVLELVEETKRLGVLELVKDMKYLAKSSSKESLLRMMEVKQVEWERIIIEAVEPEGEEEPPQPRNTLDELKIDMREDIMKHETRSLSYISSRSKVTLKPLVPLSAEE
jgi:hypothetical protein